MRQKYFLIICLLNLVGEIFNLVFEDAVKNHKLYNFSILWSIHKQVVSQHDYIVTIKEKEDNLQTFVKTIK